MDSETGECCSALLFQTVPVTGETEENRRDLETGEKPAGSKLNQETGEIECNYNQPKTDQIKRAFKIPPQYIKCSEIKLHSEPEETYTVITEDMSPAILFLLPTVFLFYPSISIICVVIEVFLHVWAHKKNKTLSNRNIYYQSPLHIITNEFCAACKDEKLKSKITKLQHQRKDKLLKKYGIEYVRRIVT